MESIKEVLAKEVLINRHIGKTKGKGHLKVWEGWGAAVSDLVLGHGMGSGCIRHWQEVET